MALAQSGAYKSADSDHDKAGPCWPRVPAKLLSSDYDWSLLTKRTVYSTITLLAHLFQPSKATASSPPYSFLPIVISYSFLSAHSPRQGGRGGEGRGPKFHLLASGRTPEHFLFPHMGDGGAVFWHPHHHRWWAGLHHSHPIYHGKTNGDPLKRKCLH